MNFNDDKGFGWIFAIIAVVVIVLLVIYLPLMFTR